MCVNSTGGLLLNAEDLLIDKIVVKLLIYLGVCKGILNGGFLRAGLEEWRNGYQANKANPKGEECEHDECNYG